MHVIGRGRYARETYPSPPAGSSAPSGTVANTRYVATTGSDTTGTGGIFSPFATIQKALDSILAASSAQPWVVRVGPGAYPDAFNLKPWIAIIGAEQLGSGGDAGQMPTEVSAGTDTIGVDASFATSAVASSWCAFLGFQNHQASVIDPTTMIPQLMFAQCAFGGEGGGGWSFANGNNTQAQAIAVLDDCTTSLGALIDTAGWGALVLRQSSSTQATAVSIANGTQPTQLLLTNSSVGTVLIEDGGFSPGASLLSQNSVIDALTAIGANTLLQLDGVGAPSTTSVLGGAPAPQWLTFAPANLADWSGVAPTSLANALNRIAAKVGPIP